MRLFKRITALALAAVTAGALGLSVAADMAEDPEDEYIGGYTLEERAAWGIDDYAENIRTVFKLTYPDEADVIDDIVDAVMGSDVFAEIFAEDREAAVQIVEDSLRDALEPSAMPLAESDEQSFTKYNVTWVGSLDDEEEISNAAAAATMALMGCDINKSLIGVENELNGDTSSNIIIYKITKLLKEEKEKKEKTDGGVSGYSYRTKAFTPINPSSSSGQSTRLVDCLSYALLYDTVPVIRLDNTDTISYYNYKDINRTTYLAVTVVDHVSESITVYDPNKRGSTIWGFQEISFRELDKLLIRNGVVWVSAFATDKVYSGLEAVKAEYPVGSYFNDYKTQACACHDWCNPGTTYNSETGKYCTCKKIDDGTQCVAFARYVFNAVKGRAEKESQSSSLYNRPVGQTVHNNAESAKDILKGLSVGTYVRVCSTSYYDEKKSHSFVIVSTSEYSITIYHANYGGYCLVMSETLTWQTFVDRFKYIQFYVV